MLSSQTVKITGASGFIGSYLLKKLKLMNVEVIGYTRNKSKESLHYVSDYALIPDGGILIHLAEERNISKLNDNIANKQVQTIEELARKKFDKIVYISSAAVYGMTNDNITENSISFADSIYAQTKLKCERVLANMTNTVIIRVSNVYGPGMATNNIISDVIKQLDAPEIRLRSLASIRDYVFVEDVVDALIEVMNSKSTGIYNVSTSIGTSVSELVTIIANVYGKVNFNLHEETMSIEGSRIVLSNKKIKNEIGWQPKFNLSMGIRSILKENAK